MFEFTQLVSVPIFLIFASNDTQFRILKSRGDHAKKETNVIGKEKNRPDIGIDLKHIGPKFYIGY